MTDPKQTLKQFMEAITHHDYHKMEEMMHEDYVYESSDGKKIEGRDAGMAFYKMMITAFPDLSVEMKNVIVSGNFIVSEFINHGTFTGMMNGIMPTNRAISIPTCNILELRDGKIIADRDYFDNALFMMQIGIEAGMEHHA
ncbi:MAG: ester cyclase [Candidatus Saccharibacteria bacterium]